MKSEANSEIYFLKLSQSAFLYKGADLGFCCAIWGFTVISAIIISFSAILGTISTFCSRVWFEVKKKSRTFPHLVGSFTIWTKPKSSMKYINIYWSIHCLGCYNRFFIMGYGRGTSIHFWRGKLAHLFSMNKTISWINSVFYSIFDLYLSYFIAQTKDFAAKTNSWSHIFVNHTI